MYLQFLKIRKENTLKMKLDKFTMIWVKSTTNLNMTTTYVKCNNNKVHENGVITNTSVLGEECSQVGCKMGRGRGKVVESIKKCKVVI